MIKTKIRNIHSRLIIYSLALIFSLILVAHPTEAPSRNYPGDTWKKVASPEVLGWSSEKLNQARKYSESMGSDAVMIIENGLIVDEWGETSQNWPVASVRKSFLSALYGIYVNKGIIDVSSSLEELGVEDVNPPLSAQEKKARIIDLLKSCSGVYHPAAAETPGMKKNRPERESHRPGIFWFYNNWDFNALGTIFEKKTDLSIFEAFKIHIADPLGMKDFRLENMRYIKEAASIHPAYDFQMSARDMARFGLLFLYEGEWEGRQIVPKSWIKESTSVHSDIGILGGYGYMWWVALNGEHFPFLKFPDGTFSARGTGEQVILIIPESNIVIVHRTNVLKPQERYMHVTEFARILKRILEAKIEK